jgi:pimeloyl-ACP methyl ester carboxylesterase
MMTGAITRNGLRSISVQTHRIGLLALLCWFGLGIFAVAQSNSESADRSDQEGNFNLPLPTLGGKQFWTDQRWHRGYRLQFNSTLRHYRILDPRNIRIAWGAKEAMVAQFETIVKNQPFPESQPHFIILLHGLGRSADSMEPLADYLEKQAATVPERKLLPFTISYASTRDSIQHHSQALCELIEHLPPNAKISFVAHSLGNIVIRHAIGRWQRNGDPEKVLSRLHRFVMLGPPNQGSVLAERLSQLKLFEVVTGAAGQQLGKAWDDLQSELATPPLPFLIVVGTREDKAIQHPLLNEANDGIVTKSEALLAGATSVEEYPQLHTYLMNDPAIMKSTWNFLISD